MTDASAHATDLVRLSETIIAKGSKSFAAAARLFDRETRAGAYLLYAWCRHCDDVIDGQELGFGSVPRTPVEMRASLEELRSQTRDALAGKPMSDPIFAAFQEVARRHQIPERHPFELLEGFAMDAEGRAYATIDDTLSYCYHVAGVVGVMMSHVMSARDAATLDRASDLGLAFQLTNIARDVVDDAKAGRIYLPRDWLAEAAIPPEAILAPEHRASLHTLAVRLLGLAEPYYASSHAGLAELPLRSRWAVATARNVYREIGREVERRGPRAWDKRVSTSRAQKLAALALGAHASLSTPLTHRLFPSQSRDGLWTRPR
jgi:phytoene synthase